nr:acyl carrier protein [uncultured Flavobacterium sp.]
MEKNEFIRNFELLFDEVEEGSIVLETVFRDVDEWSSLIALMLIAMVDESYNVKLTGDDIRESNTVNDIYNIIIAKK